MIGVDMAIQVAEVRYHAFICISSAKYLDSNINTKGVSEREFLGILKRDTRVRKQNGMVP